jgi:hypothetical protein
VSHPGPLSLLASALSVRSLLWLPLNKNIYWKKKCIEAAR